MCHATTISRNPKSRHSPKYCFSLSFKKPIIQKAKGHFIIGQRASLEPFFPNCMTRHGGCWRLGHQEARTGFFCVAGRGVSDKPTETSGHILVYLVAGLHSLRTSEGCLRQRCSCGVQLPFCTSSLRRCSSQPFPSQQFSHPITAVKFWAIAQFIVQVGFFFCLVVAKMGQKYTNLVLKWKCNRTVNWHSLNEDEEICRHTKPE